MMMGQQQIVVYVSNLPNHAPLQDIIQYLQTAGPIKQHKFIEDGQKRSVNIIYCDWQSAQTAKKYLGQKQFLGRDLKISVVNVDLKKTHPTQEQQLQMDISKMTSDQKRQTLSYLKKLKNQQSKLFQSFLSKNPKLVTALLSLGY